jgi:hypothetical protein
MTAPPQKNQTISFLSRLLDARTKAREISQRISLPSRTDESWRKIDLDSFDPALYSSPASSTVKIEGSGIDSFIIGGAGEPQIPFEPRPDLFLFEDLLPPEPDYFAVQSLATMQNLIYIRARESTTVRVRHHQNEHNATVCNTLLVDVPSGIHLTLIEEFEGQNGSDECFWNCNTRLYCDCSAELNYVALCDFARSDLHFHRFTSDQMRDSTIHLSVVHSGGRIGKGFYTARLREPGCRYRGIGVATGAGREFNDIEMSVEHLADQGESSLRYRTVLKDRAHSVFTGSLFIPEHIHGVRSQQINNNLLIGERARAESIPRLVIKSDSVQADHGATVGELSQEALWYLMSRGIPEVEARRLLIEGFIAEMVEEIAVPELRERIVSNLIQRNLNL